MNIFTGNSMWQLVLQADTTGKLVLLSLLGMSVLCWAIFFGKIMTLRLKKKQFIHANKHIMNVKNMSQLADLATMIISTAPGYFLRQNLNFYKEIAQGNFDQKVTHNEWELLEKQCDNSIESMIIHNEEYVTVLSTCAGVATLLGLFGTIWGLVHAFMRIGETQIADIATIAPGIAEALITTLAGLVVAIPAFIMFNYLQTKIRDLEHAMLIFADRMIFIMQQLRER